MWNHQIQIQNRSHLGQTMPPAAVEAQGPPVGVNHLLTVSTALTQVLSPSYNSFLKINML